VAGGVGGMVGAGGRRRGDARRRGPTRRRWPARWNKCDSVARWRCVVAARGEEERNREKKERVRDQIFCPSSVPISMAHAEHR
jgi:hypothetical protein